MTVFAAATPAQFCGASVECADPDRKQRGVAQT
jgi:hypothetical protein